jgi:HEAT repeat protein
MLGEKLDISSALPNLIDALADSNRSVRSRSVHAIGSIGPGAATAVPALLELLKRSDEESRIGACIAFRGIGQPAAPALPALQTALSDRSIDVREFAQRNRSHRRPMTRPAPDINFELQHWLDFIEALLRGFESESCGR